MSAALTIPTKFTAVDKFSSKVHQMGMGVSGFAAKSEVAMARVNRAFRTMGTPIRKVNSLLGGFGLAIGGALLLSGITSTIGIIKDFEQANADLAAVMRTASAPELKQLNRNALFLGATTAKTATQIVGLQESLGRLGFKTPAVLQMTEGIIAGANAMRAELSETADLTGAVVNTFDQFESVNTPAIMDKMVAATQRSALTFEKLQTALPIVGGAANAIGVPFEKTLALLGKLSDAGLDASMSSTALRNIFIKSKEAGKNYEDIIKGVGGAQDSLTASVQAFGVRAGVPAVVLSKKLEDLDVLFKSLTGNVKGLAVESARIRLDTIEGATILLNSAFSGFVLSVDEGTGALSNFLKTSIRVATDVFALAGGFAKAESELTPMQKSIRKTAETTIWWAKAIGIVAIGLLGLKALSITYGLVMAVINTFIGVRIFLLGLEAVALTTSATAMAAYTFMVKAATAAMWLFNASNPVGWIIIAIAAMSALVIYWDDLGENVLLVTGFIGGLINNWGMLTKAFEHGGILTGIKAIGSVILNSMLFPLQKMLEVVHQLTGLDVAREAALGIASFRAGLLELDQETQRKATIAEQSAAIGGIGDGVENPLINPKKDESTSFKHILNEKLSELNINIKGDTSGVDVEGDIPFTLPVIGSTI